MTSPLELVYEKYKHLDGCLSDPEWCTSGEGAAIYAIAGKLWQAVKEARSDGIPWCLCHEFDNNPACKPCSVRSICKQRTDVIAAQAAKKAREDFANQLKTNVNCMHEMEDFAQCGHCPYRKCKDNGYYDCDIDKVLRGSTKEITP